MSLAHYPPTTDHRFPAHRPYRRLIQRLGVVLSAGLIPVCSLFALEPKFLEEALLDGEWPDHPVLVWSGEQAEPVKLSFVVARVDLHHPGLEVKAMVAFDPDAGDQIRLTDPRRIASGHGAVVAINANGFATLPDESGEAPRGYPQGAAAEILGLVVIGGEKISGPHPHPRNNLAFWIDPSGEARFGPYGGGDARMREAVGAWWGHLLEEGRILPEAGGDRHPRTAVGVGGEGRWLFLLVVDGRRPGHSEGATLRELAELFATWGVEDAINLDGGGSSVFLAAGDDGPTILNRPSGFGVRPLPVLLGVVANPASESPNN